MDVELDDWKKNVGFPINYNSGSSDDEFDSKDVVMRNPRSSSRYLLADGGDGAEADLLGTTPPRSRIRDKEKRRNFLDSGLSFQKTIKEKKDVVDHVPSPDPAMSDRLRKRASLKVIRSKERDYKLDISQHNKADSLPSPNPMPAVPTLVESCSRFMSLTSKPKCRAACEEDVEDKDTYRSELPASRVNFHKTFSMLINMGNIDKGCRRTISREEQVWQNELKDLIWLELQAKIAGRTLAQQDAYLCVQRKIVPTVVRNILDYKFVNENPCRRLVKMKVESEHSQESNGDESIAELDEDDITFGCLTFDCALCAGAVGRALKEIGATLDAFYNAVALYPSSKAMTVDHPSIATPLFKNRIKERPQVLFLGNPVVKMLGKALKEIGATLDAFYNAVALYPSSKAMTVDHPSIATPLFKNRIKAMCLWYNTALNMRLKIVAVRLMLRSIKEKTQRDLRQRVSLDSDISRQSSETRRNCQVRFNVSTSQTPTDSSNSDSSYNKEEDTIKEEAEDCKAEDCKEEDSREERFREREEEGDSGVESMRHTGQTTPEIVLDHNHQYMTSTSESSSHEPADPCASWLSGNRRPDVDPFNLGSIQDLTDLRLLNKCPVSLYRQHHQEILKTQGVRRSMTFMSKMREHILHKVYLTLEKPDCVIMENDLEEPVEVFHDPKEEEAKTNHHLDASRTEELRRYGCWSEECRAMKLPSYRSHFLLLSCICMEAVHDYLAFRLEAKPERPSCLTVKQLMHELKEGLDIASEMRLTFVRNLRAALAGRGAGQAAGDLSLLVNTFDATVETGLKLYLSYLTTMSEKEAMPRGALQTEWTFTARLARRIKCAHHLAPQTFSTIVCNQLNRLLKLYNEKFELLTRDKTTPETTRHGVYAICRAAQNIFAEQREHTLQCAQWARALAARLARAQGAYLKERQNIFNGLMSVRDFIAEQVQYILQQSAVAEEAARGVPEPVHARVRELLLQTCRLAFQLHKELYKFVEPMRCEEAPRLRPVSLQHAPRHRLAPRRRPDTVLINESFNLSLPGIHKELHGFVHESGNRSRRSVTTASPPRFRHKFVRSDSVIEDYDTAVFEDKLFDHITHAENQTQSSIELLLSGYTTVPNNAETSNSPEGEDQVDRTGACATETADTVELRVSESEACSRVWGARVARAVIQFAKCWMTFVVQRCDKGRGLRPRWASQGLEFLMLACDPCNTRYLTEEEFEELKHLMDGCISHVIGSRRADAGSPSPRPRARVPSPLSPPASKDVATTTPTADDGAFNGLDTQSHQQRVVEAISRLEEARDSSLRSSKSVGKVVTAPTNYYDLKLRQLTFKWQRGLKIGQGTFGKVYTVVNTESGQLLAMKELSMLANDRRAFQRAANELRVLEGVIHPHLVRHYGAELHREEMLIFMELCVEGSLEALLATSGALAEHTTRRYTKQLLSAVHALHSRSIVHRDIKSGNIFLTNEGHCLKLGDFGCAVKIRANSTAPGELQGFVGTQAYMAPEVFMGSSGHGRAADVWSLGCVVTEMASGKRPFSEMDSNYQIMFRVGMGARPAIPPALSEEGREFCEQCLTHDPTNRPRASDLMLHTFLMVNSDDSDCKCEPAYLITK